MRMKIKITQFIKTYILFVLVFVVQKPLFMLWYHVIYQDAGWKDFGQVLWHGLKLDASMAGYLTILPGILLILSLWFPSGIIRALQKVYFGLVSLLLSVIFVSDLALYKYWGFRLDSTPLFYLRSPQSALASVDGIVVLAGVLSMLVLAVLLYLLFYRILIRESRREKLPRRPIPAAVVLLLFTALLFIPIRGGFGASSMNVGKVYYSPVMVLNHAAVNPCFSLMESLFREQDFAGQYRFMSDEEAANEFETLQDQPVTDSIPALFTIKRPNVIFIVLESFMSGVMEPLGGFPEVAVTMNRLADEGVLFTNFYANSFRTDRGLVSIFSGYPAQPTTSIMKYPRKSQSLPSIPKSLKKAGYDLEYYYGGDADFTNMRSYLVSCGIDRIVSDVDFPVKDRLSKWGAPDDVVFSRLMKDLKQKQKEPFLKILQTSSSHEPFDVPYRRLNDPYLNSVAYTDSCLGAFVNSFRKTPYWENSVLIMVADHSIYYEGMSGNYDTLRYRIPLLMAGGAVNQAMKVPVYASQIDIAATLLYQLDLPHEEFKFSKNILNPASPHFGYFTNNNLFGMITAGNQLVYDCDLRSVTGDSGNNKGENLKKGQAFLQVLYDDLAKR